VNFSRRLGNIELVEIEKMTEARINGKLGENKLATAVLATCLWRRVI